MLSELPADWNTQTIEESMEAIIDYRGKTPRKSTFGVPLITAKIVKGGRLLPATEFIAAENYDSWMVRGLPKVGDVVMTTEAPLGEVAQIEDPNVGLAQRIITLRASPAVLDNTFLRYALQCSEVQAQLQARASGTTVMGIRQSELRHVVLPCPPLQEQHAIAEVLGTLDKKIGANRALNEMLEATCQALFRSWCVDFDPVVAKSEGRRPAHLADDVAALFPDRFEDSPLGPVPAGWRVGTVGDIATNPRRKAAPASVAPSTPYIGLEHMPRRSIMLDAWGEAAAVTSAKWGFRSGEVLFGKLRPYFHKVGVALCDGICSTDILVVAPKQAHDFGVLLGTLSSPEFVDYADGTAGGTRQPRTSWHDMARYTIAIPPEPIRAQLTRVARLAEDHFRTRAAETRTLATLRDALLPRLLSGELRVRQAEQPVEEAI